MNAYHTIIIGGGPGGLMCATSLARAGRKVLLLERNNRIGPKVCAGGLPLSSLSLGLPEDILERRFHRQRIHSNWQHISLSADRPIICTVDREKLGQWMLTQAREAGVAIHTGEAAKIIGRGLLTTPRNTYRYKYLVGADGSASMVRRFLGIKTERLGTGIHYQIPGRFKEMEWHLNSGLFHNGYAWIFPHRHSASIGVYASLQTMHAKVLHEKLHRWATKYGIDLRQEKPRAALINYDYRGWRFDNIFLVGDAAGLASGLTGEGIYSALLSGQAVAETIVSGKTADKRLAKLIKRHRRHTRMLERTAGNRIFCAAIMETLLLALRAHIIPYNAVELGD